MKGQSPASAPNCLDFSRSSVSAPDEALRTMSCSLYTFRQWFLAAQARRVKGTDWPHGGIVVGGMERATGIEPVSSAWKAEVLPLHNARSADQTVISYRKKGQVPCRKRPIPSVTHAHAMRPCGPPDRSFAAVAKSGDGQGYAMAALLPFGFNQ